MHLWVHRQGKFKVVEHYGEASKMSCRSPGDLPITFRMIKTNEKKFEKMFFLLHLSFIFCVNCVVIAQRWIQTTSTYANAEVTFSVVKLLKNTGIPIFSTKLLSSFLLPIEKIRKS